MTFRSRRYIRLLIQNFHCHLSERPRRNKPIQPVPHTILSNRKLFLILPLLLLTLNNAYACSCDLFYAFCSSHTKHDITLSGVIVDSLPNGITMKVLQVFHGIDQRDTIPIWDLGGPYDLCNDSTSGITRATSLGNVGDTVIVALPRIDTIKNPWDNIGDYRVPGFICWEYKLTVNQHTVEGKISGGPYCHFTNNCLETYDYDSFIVDFPTKSKSCTTWLTVDPNQPEIYFHYYPNPSTSQLSIETLARGVLTITQSNGQVIDVIEVENHQTTLSTHHWPPGLYVLIFETERVTVSRKLLVH